jgi:hypothetical protein
VTAPDVARPGAYGFAVEGLVDTSALVPAGADWPLLTVELAERHAPQPPTSVTDDSATIPLRDGTLIELDRARGVVRFSAPTPLAESHVTHPGLGFAAVPLAHWAGRECFHGGGFVAGQGAWGVMGTTGSGKSTLLAALALAGCEIVSDDFLVAGARAAYAGPRCLDLREPVPAKLGIEGEVSLSPRARPRLALAPTRPVLPLRGWLVLEWGESPELVPIPAGERLTVLAGERIWPPLGTAVGLLDLASLPAWRLRRPRRWGAVSQTVELLLAAVSDRREPGGL